MTHRKVHTRYKNILEGNSKGIGNDTYYGYQKNLYEIVENNLSKFGFIPKDNSITLIRGLVQNTMKINRPVAFAHIDVDWYEPVRICLEQIFPNLIIGGCIILDDYDCWGGCRTAINEYFQNKEDVFEMDSYHGSLKVTKIKN